MEPIEVNQIGDAVFCNLKFALKTQFGDIRTPEKERGRKLRQVVPEVIASRGASRTDLAKVRERYEEGKPFRAWNLRLNSEELGLQGRPTLVDYDSKSLSVYKTSSGLVRQAENANYGAAVWDDEGAQLIAFGLLLRNLFQKQQPRLFLVRVKDDFKSQLESEDKGAFQALLAHPRIEVPFSESSASDVQGLIDRMRSWRSDPAAATRNHDQDGKCRRCDYSIHCPEKLV